jgi:hypothetical protein
MLEILSNLYNEKANIKFCKNYESQHRRNF